MCTIVVYFNSLQTAYMLQHSHFPLHCLGVFVGYGQHQYYSDLCHSLLVCHVNVAAVPWKAKPRGHPLRETNIGEAATANAERIKNTYICSVELCLVPLCLLF